MEDPASTRNDPSTGQMIRDQFLGNAIPQGRISLIAEKMLSYLPLRCLIGDADSESQAREELVTRWDSSGAEAEELILSVRELPKGTFISRWWPSEYAADEGPLPGQLDGGISDESDVYEREYLVIEAVHKKASDEMAGFSDEAPLEPTTFDWDSKLQNNLTEAVRAEMRRGNLRNESIQ